MTVRHINQIELSRRWGISHRTLERWRSLDTGPTYVKIGGRVVYRMEDVERYEDERTRKPRHDNATTTAMGDMA